MTINKDDIIAALKTAFDTEVPVNLWDMGLVYDIGIRDGAVDRPMTFTSPTCPMMEELMHQIETVVKNAAHGADVHIALVWDPPWNPSMMSDAARLELDLTEQGW